MATLNGNGHFGKLHVNSIIGKYKRGVAACMPVLPFSRKFPFLRKFCCRKGKSKEEKKSKEI